MLVCYYSSAVMVPLEHRWKVFENIVMKIFAPKREGIIGGEKELHNEELHNLYSSPIIIRVIKSRRLRWVGHVARLGHMKNMYKNLVG